MALISLVAISFSVSAQDAELSRAYQLQKSERYADAVKLLDSTLKKYPLNADLWYQYGRALQSDGQLDGAEKVWLKVRALPGYQAFADFQLALIYGTREDVEGSERHLANARASGYINFDRFKNETGLAAVRRQGLIEFPPESEFHILKARNRLTVPYLLVLPDDYDASKTYKGLVAFPPGDGGRASADWALANLWSGENSEWIVVIPVVPEPEGEWMTHPSHHALNDLMDHVRENYRIEDRQFHALGFHSGALPAATFSLMSKSYFKSVTTVGAWAWDDWDDKDLKGFRRMPVNLIVADGEPFIRQVNQHARDVMMDAGAEVNYVELSGEDQNLTSTYSNRLLGYLR